jgi:hypothetical protein
MRGLPTVATTVTTASVASEAISVFRLLLALDIVNESGISFHRGRNRLLFHNAQSQERLLFRQLEKKIFPVSSLSAISSLGVETTTLEIEMVTLHLIRSKFMYYHLLYVFHQSAQRTGEMHV